ncbi:hypothetical protein [Bacillus sp. JJ722]|uniref:hypothetical protein n=1 Tax=Bacillus sp. JJ722 TaxID=3122973 RepID=UPI002FFD8619
MYLQVPIDMNDSRIVGFGRPFDFGFPFLGELALGAALGGGFGYGYGCGYDYGGY